MLSPERYQPSENRRKVPFTDSEMVVKWWSRGGHDGGQKKSLPVFAGQGLVFGRGARI
jgi:hypothetical protein